MIFNDRKFLADFADSADEIQLTIKKICIICQICEKKNTLLYACKAYY